MPFHAVTNPDDPRLAPYRSIQDRDREGVEGRPGRFIGETALVVETMVRIPGCVESILATPKNETRVREMLAATSASDPDVLVVPQELVEPLTGFNLHRGLMAVGRRPQPRSLPSIIPAGTATLLCVEDVNNLDNIGQLFRVAAAFGCCGALLSPTCHDPLYRKSLRVSCGCALKLPFVRSADWHADLAALRTQHGMAMVGATGSGEETLQELAQRAAIVRGNRIAVVVGAEFAGLTAETLALCHHRVRIPMAPGVDSLNVAVAAAVFLSHLSPITNVAEFRA